MPPRSPPWKSKHSQSSSGSYLANLRANRTLRPAGSRPPPFKSNTANIHSPRLPLSPPEQSHEEDVSRSQKIEDIVAQDTITISTKRNSVCVTTSPSAKGRPLAQAPSNSIPTLPGRNSSSGSRPAKRLSATQNYAELASNLLEKEEAHTLREALKLIDQVTKETRLFQAAQMEAADLVWKHRNPQAAEAEVVAPYANPDKAKRKSYGAELTDIQSGTGNNQSRSASDSSTASNDPHKTDKSKRKSKRLSNALLELQKASEERAALIVAKTRTVSGSRQSSGQRQASGGQHSGIFRNPDDQIYEEPSMENLREMTSPPPQERSLPLRARERNSLPYGSRPLPVPEKSFSIPLPDKKLFNKVEIQRNAPSQSRNAGYRSNPVTSPPVEVIEEVETPKSTKSLEIRSDDIRAATSMKRKDRSPNLPTPSAVSDVLGRPIVSFDPSWKSIRDSPRGSQDLDRPSTQVSSPSQTANAGRRPPPRPVLDTPAVIVSAPAVPTIQLPDEESNNDIPIITVQEDASTTTAAPTAPRIQVDTPTKSRSMPRPQPKIPSHSAPIAPTQRSARLPWLNGPSRTSTPAATCACCSLPISGRIVTASGSSANSARIRFHPECFTCHHCSAPLECVSFYPEPEAKRNIRLEEAGFDLASPEAQTIDPRFYCHLDFHEFFSPRCRSCKTPIEGEVIIAAGGEYHVGHFFCGECGDPFNSTTPFVEKDGYAYCVSCHTRRTSARCRECKNQILDELTVEALGGKWHESCFRCYECGDGFGDEGRFFVRDIIVEPTEKEKRKGVSRKVEERAVCHDCEERRLKA